MEYFESAASDMRGWYGKGIPSRMGSRFYDFAIRTHELANLVVNYETKFKVSPKIPTACCDGETIYLPAGYFTDEYYDFLGIPKELHSACAIACINGSQIHEAFHLHESICKLDEMISPYLKNPDDWLKKPGFSSCLQLTEDLYIEEWGRVNREFLSDPFIVAKNNVLFPENKFEEIYGMLKNPLTRNQDTLLQLLTFLKNQRFQGDERFNHWAEIISIFEEARDVEKSKEDRVRIAVRAWEKLKDETAENGEKLEEGKGDPSEGFDPNNFSGFGVPDENKFVDASGADAVAYGEFLKTLSEEGSDQLSDLAKKVNEELEVIEHERLKGAESKNKWPDVKVIHVTEMEKTKVESDPKFNKFGNFLRRAKEVKHVPGEPKTSGTNLLTHRLAHIASDGKVFSFIDANKIKRGKPEVIFLMDFSGSMSGLAYKVAMATQGAHISLIQAGVPVATYAHTSFLDTSEMKYKETPAVFPIAAYDLPFGSSKIIRHSIEATKIRFGQSTNINKRENFDGVAIEFCSQQFTTRQGTKVLVVLSDGSPQGGSYYTGDFAEEHTKETVRKLRKKGIIVISLSLTTGVYSDNNTIYGKDFNFQAWGENLDQSLKSLSYQISIGGKLK